MKLKRAKYSHFYAIVQFFSRNYITVNCSFELKLTLLKKPGERDTLVERGILGLEKD